MGAGKHLRQAREGRGLTIRDVADLTKISSRQVDAIETEHYEKLPGGIFGRGYVRALATALKLDADALVEAYRDETEGEDLTVPSMAFPGRGRINETPRRPPARVAASWRAEIIEPRLRMAPADDDALPRPGRRLIAAVLLGMGAILLILWLGRERGALPVSLGPEAVASPRAASSGAPGSSHFESSDLSRRSERAEGRTAAPPRT